MAPALSNHAQPVSIIHNYNPEMQIHDQAC